MSIQEILPEPLDQRPNIFASSRYQVASGLYGAIAHTNEPEQFRDTAFLYAAQFDMGIPVNSLLDVLDDKDRKDVFEVMSDLTALADDVGALFPDELSYAATEAYGELTTSILWAFGEISDHGRIKPSQVMLRSGRPIDIRGFSFKQALTISHGLLDATKKIINSTQDKTGPVHRVNQDGKFGMYRIGEEQDVLLTIKLVDKTGYDNAIEYGGQKGSEASIGYSVDTGRDHNSVYKSEQKSPFCIRIDNEGETLSLDVGSILSKSNTLGNQVADLITVGDDLRARKFFENPERGRGLNHSKKYFHPKHSDRKEFARIASVMAAEFENRWQANRAGHPSQPV